MSIHLDRLNQKEHFKKLKNTIFKILFFSFIPLIFLIYKLYHVPDIRNIRTEVIAMNKVEKNSCCHEHTILRVEIDTKKINV